MRKGIKALEKSAGKDLLENRKKSMLLGTIGSLKYDLGKFLVSVIAESRGFRIIEVGNVSDLNSFRKLICKNSPLAVGLSGLSLKLLSEGSSFDELNDITGYRDKASFVVFSPPVSKNVPDRLSVTFYSDFKDKSIKQFLEVMERSFHRIKLDKNNPKS
jgi:methanogenic corrinoid protein MtbC1